MITDISVIIWKEAKEIILQRPNFRGGWLGLLVLIGMFGILLPLQSGPEWLTSPINLAIWAWVPYLLVSGVVADSIAGERERHTLETLLASRLSDTAILFGKIAAAVLYGWGLTLISALVSMIVINLVHGHGRLLLFSLPIGVGVFVLSFLVSLLAAGLGVLISLRASTVRQAQQTFNVIFLLFFIPLLLLPMLPVNIRLQASQVLVTADVNLILLSVVMFLIVIDLVLLGVARFRFQRSKLIVD